MLRFMFFGVVMVVSYCVIAKESIFIIGNSLSRHEPLLSIGWKFDHGMAATEPEKDYAHILCQKVAELTGSKPDLKISRMNQEKDMIGLPAAMPEKADIVVLQVGDNYKRNLDKRELKKRYGDMLRSLKKNYPEAIVIAVSDWGAGPTKEMQEAAHENSIPWVYIKDLSLNPKMKAAAEKNFTNQAINWHPGNTGMATIADRIWNTLKPLIQNRQNRTH